MKGNVTASYNKHDNEVWLAKTVTNLEVVHVTFVQCKSEFSTAKFSHVCILISSTECPHS